MVNKQSNDKDFFLHIVFSKSNSKFGTASFYVPSGPFFEGWFAMASALENLISFSSSLNKSVNRNFVPSSFPPIIPPSSKPSKSYAQAISQSIQVPKHNFNLFAANSPFTCDRFTTPSSVTIHNSRQGEFIKLNPLHSDNPLGNWRDAYVISSNNQIHHWQSVGDSLGNIFKLNFPIYLYPISSTQDLFHYGKDVSCDALNLSFEYDNSIFSVYKRDKSFWQTAKNKFPTDFRVETYGVPFRLWTSKLMNTLGRV